MPSAIFDSPAADVATLEGQFLTFCLDDESLGIPILEVQEIRGCAAVTRMPNTPAHVRGVINLRGSVVPILDLRSLFGLPEAPSEQVPVVIVVNVESRIVGLVVDGVSDVLTVTAGSVEPPPELCAGVDVSVVTGLAKDADRLVTLLDVSRVVGKAVSAVPLPGA